MQQYRAQRTQDEYQARIEEIVSREQEDLAKTESQKRKQLDELWRTRTKIQKAQEALGLLLTGRDPGDATNLLHRASLEDENVGRAILEFKTRALERIGRCVRDEANRATEVVSAACAKLDGSLVRLDDMGINAGQFCFPIWLVFYSAGRDKDLRCLTLGPQMKFEVMSNSPFRLSRMGFCTVHQKLLEELKQDIDNSFEYFLNFAKSHNLLCQTPRFRSVVVPKIKAFEKAGMIRKSLVDFVIRDIGGQSL